MSSLDRDHHFLRMTFELAQQARALGTDPVGCILLDASGNIVQQVYEQSVFLSDPTAHAEMLAIREQCRSQRLYALEGYTLYTNVEPCMMCAGAIYWARISRVVFGISQAMLQQMTGGRPKPDCRSILQLGHKPVEVVGPLLVDEALRVFAGHQFIRRAEQHRLHFSNE